MTYLYGSCCPRTPSRSFCLCLPFAVITMHTTNENLFLIHYVFMSMFIVLRLFGADLDLGLRSRLRHTEVLNHPAELPHHHMLAWPIVESLSFSSLNLEYNMINVNLETLAENIQLPSLESGSWHMTLWQTCLVSRAELALHSISKHLKHFLSVIFSRRSE